MSLLAKLKRTTDIQPETDRPLNGGRKQLEAGVHDFVIEYAYLEEATSGALAVVIKFTSPDGEFTTREWIMSGREKGSTNFYTDKQGNKRYLPGFVTASNIVRLTLDKELDELEPEDKVLMLYDGSAGRETPQTKPVLVDLSGCEITLGIKKILEDGYKDPTKSRTNYEIVTVFHTATGCTVPELEADMTKGAYIETFRSKFTGEAGVVDKRVQSKEGAKPSNTAELPDAPFNSAGTAAAPKKKLLLS